MDHSKRCLVLFLNWKMFSFVINTFYILFSINSKVLQGCKVLYNIKAKDKVPQILLLSWACYYSHCFLLHFTSVENTEGYSLLKLQLGQLMLKIWNPLLKTVTVMAYCLACFIQLESLNAGTFTFTVCPEMTENTVTNEQKLNKCNYNNHIFSCKGKKKVNSEITQAWNQRVR